MPLGQRILETEDLFPQLPLLSLFLFLLLLLLAFLWLFRRFRLRGHGLRFRRRWLGRL